MDEMRSLTDYLNTALGAAALAAATFAANWVRNVVHKYFKYLEAKVARWSLKPQPLPEYFDPTTRKVIEAIVSEYIQRRIKERRESARTPPG